MPTSTNGPAADPAARTLWDVLAGGEGSAGSGRWAEPVGGPDFEPGLARPRPRLAAVAAKVARQRIAAAVQAQLAGDELRDRLADVWSLYEDVADAVQQTDGVPEARARVPVGHMSRIFTHVVEVTVSYEGWRWTTRFDARLQLDVDPAEILVDEGAVVAVGAGAGTAEGTLLWEGQELLVRRCRLDFEALVGPGLRLDSPPRIPAQLAPPPTIQLPRNPRAAG